MKNPTTKSIEHALIAALCAVSILAGLTFAHATTVDTISGNVNDMRQLTPDNIVRRIPGAAPYYGPAMCQQLLPFYEKNLTAFDPAYTCTCPSQKQPPACSGPPHFDTATTTCAP